VVFDFTHGETSNYVLAELPEAIRLNLALHGLSQKCGDAYSSEKDPAEAKAKADEVWARLKSGEWVIRRARGEGSVTLTIEAVAAIQGRPTAEIQAVWDSLDEERKKAVRADAAVKAKMAEIKAARLAAKAEGDEGESALGVFG